MPSPGRCSGRRGWAAAASRRSTAGDGKVYALDREGTLHVFAADSTETLLAALPLEEDCAATPALGAGVVFVRTAGHLCCIGSGE